MLINAYAVEYAMTAIKCAHKYKCGGPTTFSLTYDFDSVSNRGVGGVNL